METKKSLNKYKESVLSIDDVIELLLERKSIKSVVVDSEHEVSLYNEHSEDILQNDNYLKENNTDDSIEEYFHTATNTWIFPQKYQDMYIEKYLLDLCKTQEERERIEYELTLFKARDLYIMLKFFVFLVDFMRENGIVWGVGRGSSVASFSLYLIGVHRINTLEYQLSIEEFLK